MSETLEKINLDILVNKEGLTLKDLLTTLMNELSKNGMYCAGVISKAGGKGMVQVFGHQSQEDKEHFPIRVMQDFVARYKSDNVVAIERIGGRKV